MAIDAVNLDQTDVTTELYKAVIGPRNQGYYLRRFAKFDADGKTGATWHWPAFFSTLNWLIFRKMWGLALWFASLSLTLALAVFGLGKLALNYSDATQNALILLFLLAAFVLPGLYANSAYYRFCEKKITKALASDSGVQGACELLARQASSNRRWFVLALLNLLILALVAGAARLAPDLNLAEKSKTIVSSEMKSASIGAAGRATTPPAALPRVAEPALPASAPGGMKECPDCPDATAAPADRISPPSVEAGSGKPRLAAEASMPGPSEVQAQAATTAKREPMATTKKSEPANATVKPATPSPAASSSSKAEAMPADNARKSTANQPDIRYFLQVGAFAEEGNARNALAKLEAIGLPAFTQPVQAGDGRLIRIRVGPFNSKAEAGKAASKIRALDFPVLILKL